MWQQKLISQLVRSKWCIQEAYAKAQEQTVQNILRGASVEVVEKEAFVWQTNTSLNYESDIAYRDATPDSVAIIPIRNALFRYDTWCDYGAETYNYAIQQALDTDNISAIILKEDTPGGSTSAMTLLEHTLRTAHKPIVAYVDDMSMSAGYFIAALCSKIVASHPMAEVGSIGVMASMTDSRKADEMEGYKTLYFYPEESAFKNRNVREALDGNDTNFLKEQLSPFAQYFQNVVKDGRPNLDLSVEGIIGGKEFYAKDAKEYGLVDEIMPLADAILYAQDLAKTLKQISTL